MPSFLRSSLDTLSTKTPNLQWDYAGNYQLHDVQGYNTLNSITLDYDFFGDDYFEPYVINDSTIKLYHPDSVTTYEFSGGGYQHYLKSYNGLATRKRTKSSNPTTNVVRKKSK